MLNLRSPPRWGTREESNLESGGEIDKQLKLTTLPSSKSVVDVKKISITVHSDGMDHLAFRRTC